MTRKSKFKPVITRVKLSPEQAVLSCDCYDVDRESYGADDFPGVTYLEVCYYSWTIYGPQKSSITEGEPYSHEIGVS